MTVEISGGATRREQHGGSVLPAPEEKPTFVRDLFDAIAPRYYLLNSVLSARLHHGWRRWAAREAGLKPGDTALDVCTGTCDLAFELARFTGPAGPTDFSARMLRAGESKRAKRPNANAQTVRLSLTDTEALSFSGNSFDAVAVGFGIRNVANIEAALREMARVAKPGGRIVIIDFGLPRNPVFAALYRAYSFKALPRIGDLVSGRRGAYGYLSSSIRAFHTREALADRMRRAGLADARYSDLMFGTVVVHRGIKGQ